MIEEEISRMLKEILVQKIRSNYSQVIPFEQFMNTVLYHIGLGFYSNHLPKFGREGHFITAPGISSIFSGSLVKQIEEIFSFGLSANNILELGAGDGRLAVDILSRMGNSIDRFYILELNAVMKLHQKRLITELVPELTNKVYWLDSLPEEFVGVVIANEVLDAIPCNLIKIDDNGNKICGIGVGLQDLELVEKGYDLTAEILEYAQGLALAYNNYKTEVNLAVSGLIASLAKMLSTGAMIFIDYGFSQKEYYAPHKSEGNLRGFYRHKVYSDVFSNLGLMDITTDVNFTQVAMSGIDSGLDLIGYTNQSYFLLNCSLEFSEELCKQNDLVGVKRLHDLHTLISPSSMGSVFKVMGFSKNMKEDQWLGFNEHDLTYQL